MKIIVGKWGSRLIKCTQCHLAVVFNVQHMVKTFLIRVLWYNFPLVMLFCFSLHHRSGLNCDKNSLKLNNRSLCCLDWACNLIRTGHLNSWGAVWHCLHNHTSAFIWPVQRPLEMLGSVLWKSAFIFWTSADGAEHVPKMSHRWCI